MNYIEIKIKVTDETIKEILIAQLAEINFEGFEEKEDELVAFAIENDFSENELAEILSPFNLSYNKEIILPQNWNAVWESNFDPVIVDNFVSIIAHFHKPILSTTHQILITPKMSFGTGHHATTYSVMQLMRDIDFKNKTVFDFGTGTGILAILAEKLGAKFVLAIDNDDWCIENASENIMTNQSSKIKIEKANTAKTNDKFDIVIANINKNIIKDNFEELNNCCKDDTIALLSGLLIEDEKDILELSKTKNWVHLKTISKGGWIAIQFKISISKMR